MSKTGDVTVIDRVPYSAAVSPEQAAAYCRRNLPRWIERAWHPFILFTSPDHLSQVQVPAPGTAGFVDYSRRMAELCDALVKLGVARLPSEVLRAMAAEVAL